MEHILFTADLAPFADVLQAAPIEWWAEGRWFDAAFDPITSLIGETLFGLLVAGTVILSMYIAGNGGMAGPTVLLFIISGIMFQTLPGDYVNIARTIAVIGMVAGLMTVARRYVLSP